MKKLYTENILFIIGGGVLVLLLVMPVISTGLNIDSLKELSFLSYNAKFLRQGSSNAVFLMIMILIAIISGFSSVYFAMKNNRKPMNVSATISFISIVLFILIILYDANSFQIKDFQDKDKLLTIKISLNILGSLVLAISSLSIFAGLIISAYKSHKASETFMAEASLIFGIISIGLAFISILPCLDVLASVIIPLSIFGITAGIFSTKKINEFISKAGAGFVLSVLAFVGSIGRLILSSC